MKKIVLAVFCLLLPCWIFGGEEVFLNPSKQIYDKNGLLLRGLLSGKNTYAAAVPLSEISPWIIGAAVAAEDKRFFEHSGVDSAAVLRALWQNTQEGEVVSGASTITQQLVRTLKPRPKTMWGKAKEAFSAVRLEKTQTKEEILEQYFNAVELGNLTQGMEAASRFYFNTPAAEVSLSQAAFLVGLIKSPTYYNPFKYLDRAVKRRDYVLKRMKEEGLINDEMYLRAKEEKIVLQKMPRPFEAPHFMAFIMPLIPSQSSSVFTTLDAPLQTFVQQTVKAQISRLETENVTNGAAVVIENATGNVLAYVGSADFYNARTQGQVDGVRALRQPGSALKPFVYALNFENGSLTPASLLEDSDTFFAGGFRPHNYDEKFHGQVSVRTALANSYNIPAVRAAEKAGLSPLLEFLLKNGFSSLSKPADFYGLGISLGNGEVRLLELVNAYVTLARGGIYKPLTVAVFPPIVLAGQERRVMNEKTAYLVTEILSDNNARAAAFGLNSPLSVPFELAAKTGTSKDYKDNFALGYTNRWTIGVWVGNFDAQPMRKISGVTGAGPILHEIALYMEEKYPSQPFAPVKGVVRKLVCARSGLLAGENCPHIYEEVFDEHFVPPVCDGKHISPAKTSFRIISPVARDVYKLDPAVARASQVLLLKADCPHETCTWKMDGKNLETTACQTGWMLTAGKHKASCTCGTETKHVSFQVLE